MGYDLNTHLEEVTKLANLYVETKELQHMEALENNLKTLFDAEEVRLWRFNPRTNGIELIARELENTILLDLSLTNQAIYGKHCIYENHVTSNKYYSSKIDNPLNFKMKALIIYPIIKEGRVLAVLKISRGTKHKKTFSKKDGTTLSNFDPFLISILESKVIEKEELLAVTGDKKAESSSKNESKQIPIPKLKKTEKDTPLLKELEEKCENLSKKNLKYAKNEALLRGYKEDFIKLERIHSDKKEKHDALEEKFKEAHKESKKSTSLAMILKKENIELRQQLEKKNAKDMKSEKSMPIRNSKNNIDTNIEHILQHIDSDLSSYGHTYILFELILYTIGSEKGLDYVESHLKKSTLLEEIVAAYAFKRNLKIHNEKYRTDALVKHIKKCQSKIFIDSMSIVVSINESVPASLIMDAPKLQSVIFHLLLDLHLFVDYDKDITVDISYANKILSIEFIASVQSKNSFFKSMFKQKKSKMSEENRLDLKLGKEIIAFMKGNIDYSYDNTHYTCTLALPAPVIKM